MLSSKDENRVTTSGEWFERVLRGPDSALFSAISRNNLDDVRAAIKNGAKIQKFVSKTKRIFPSIAPYRYDFWSSLHYASGLGRSEVVKVLLENGADRNVRGDSGRTPLHLVFNRYFLDRDFLDVVKVLLEGGADPDVQEDYRGRTPLHLAVINAERLDAVQVLLEGGANCNVQDYRGRTPLHHAAKRGHLDIVRTLAGCGNISEMTEVRDYAGKTPLHYAVIYGFAECVQALLQAGANVNIENDRKETPLHVACKGIISEDCVRILLAYHPDLTIQDENGVSVRDALRKDNLFSNFISVPIIFLQNLFSQQGKELLSAAKTLEEFEQDPEWMAFYQGNREEQPSAHVGDFQNNGAGNVLRFSQQPPNVPTRDMLSSDEDVSQRPKNKR